ncbi:hypothetical protein V6N11_076271 [Hibiscus sabdariffa]|uniref:Uncharacterized protein n=1 Tax=Hibiscus sabdariffa TaxID=183260 RepID=A0ABR2Q5S4_9ROSI
MLRDSSAPTASGVDSHEPDLPRPDTDFPDPGCLHASSHSPSAMDISLHVFPALTLKHAPFGMHVSPSIYTPVIPLPSSQPGLVSYKDSLMAIEPSQNPAADTFEIDDEVLLAVGDFTRFNVDGLISIIFSERIQALAAKSLDLTVVIKLLGRQIGYNTLHTSAKSISLIMEPQDNISVERNNNGKSQAKFPSAKQRKSHAKSPLTKQRSPTTVRKPLSVQLPTATPSSKPTLLPTRLNSSLSSDRFAPFPHQSHRSNKSRHTAVVVVENDDPTAPGCDSLPVPAHNSHVDTIVSSLFGVVMPPSLDDTSIVCQVLTNVAVFTLDECLTETQSQDQ